MLEGTVQNYNLTFDLSWKVMKDILVKVLGINDIALGSPRANLQAAFLKKECRKKIVLNPDTMSARESTCLHDRQKANGIMC